MSKTYGFFHPFCNAGGGGERVLWQAVKDTLIQDKESNVVIFTGDVGVSKEDILANALHKFDIAIDESRVEMIYLSTRWLVDSKTWPQFTLLGQAIGSMILTFEAINKFQPDVWIDTMGYPFSYPVVWFWLNVPVVTYTHFPIISRDMLNKLSESMRLNPTWKKSIKYTYWKLFMLMYTVVGNFVDIGTTNSTWTNNHVTSIWKHNKNVRIIFPPCSTEKLVKECQNNPQRRENSIVFLAQFRPEKRHDLVIEEFAKYLSYKPTTQLKLVLIGSTRDDNDKNYVKSLQKLAKERLIPDLAIEFKLNVKFSEVLNALNTSTFGLNAMWNEHFGIAVVEYMANGLIPVVHSSAGPLYDIVVPWDAKAGLETKIISDDTRTGFFFKSEKDPDHDPNEKFETLSEVLLKISKLSEEQKAKMRENGRELVVEKFCDAKFDREWNSVLNEVDYLLKKRESQVFTNRNVLFISSFIMFAAVVIKVFVRFSESLR